jgi:hypothetical protein
MANYKALVETSNFALLSNAKSKTSTVMRYVGFGILIKFSAANLILCFRKSDFTRNNRIQDFTSVVIQPLQTSITVLT